MTKKFILYICLPLSIIALILCFILFLKEKNYQKESYKKTYRSVFKDRLLDVRYENRAGIHIFLPDQRDFLFVQTSESREKVDFIKFAAIGDTVIKNSNSDTIYIKRDKFFYAFMMNPPEQ